MIRLKTTLLIILLLLPPLFLIGAGGWALWDTGWLFWVWWVLPFCWGLAFLLQKRWQLFLIPMPAMQLKTPVHWTPRDEEASSIVEVWQKRVSDVSTDQLATPQYYLDTAKQLSFEIARHYHPRAADPWGSVTITEILAAAQLALADVEDWANRYVPGSQMISLKTWRAMSNANRWADTAYSVYWVGSILLNPLNLGRMLASKVAVEPLTGRLQTNILGAFYVFFVRQVGFYAIELNSGRLRGGVHRYRTMMAALEPESAATAPSETKASPASTPDSPNPDSSAVPANPVSVTLAVVGQVKAGKSSLVNALLGEERAKADVVPLTEGAQSYQLQIPGRGDRLHVVDTAGYGTDAIGEESWKASLNAVRNSDLVLLAIKATSPAKAADLHFLQNMDAWYLAHPERKPPEVLVVLTHIDGLSPAMEWSPPYHWETPTGRKEEQIRGAVHHVHETFGRLIAGAVPACCDVSRGRSYGISEFVVPAIMDLLGEARGAAFVRQLHSEFDAARLRQVLEQLKGAGRKLLQMARG